uniref:Uncharacterized protein n=1 Tax=Neolamprologus brichardi TaxID=32507 RepID=A0A3Q4HH12_NEOBR
MLQDFSPSADVCPPPPPASVPPGMFPPQSSTAGINPFSRKAGGSRDQLHNILALRQLEDFVKHLEHTEQTKGRTPLWIFWCSAMRLARANLFPQSEQEKGLSPRCLRSWRFRARGLLKVLPQCVHGKGLSLVCMFRSCFRRSDERMKSLPQVSQMYGFSPVCVRICLRRLCCCSVP